MICLNKNVRLAIFLAISIVLSIVESFIPIINGSFFGIKLGLANIVFVYILYKYSFKDALLISILRVFLVGMIRTGIFNSIFLFSLSGAVFSLIMMYIFKKVTKLSIVGVSIIGSISHMIAQLVCVSIFISNFNFITFVPIILIVSCFTGIITGMLAKSLIERV